MGIVTACESEIDLSSLESLQVVTVPSSSTTTFRNISTPEGRSQYLYHPATTLEASHLPEAWLKPKIVHLGPVASEVDPQIYKAFEDSLICLTAQGWLRGVDAEGLVHPVDWLYSHDLLKASHACVISLEVCAGRKR